MPVIIPRLVVEIFQHTRFRGRRGYVIEPVRFTGDIGFQDNISSVRVYKGSSYASSPNYKVLLHQHHNFQGKSNLLHSHPQGATLPFRRCGCNILRTS